MKKVIIVLTVILVYVLALNNLIYALSSITYFSGETIKLQDTDDKIEIISNEIIIDTTTSEIKSTILIKNVSNKEIKTNIGIPLENKDISTTIHNLSIHINKSKVEYKEENGEYNFETIIAPQEAKKIQIEYITDNDLQNAKIIKYNLENFGKKTIGKVKVDIIIAEKDIPLVTGIYPGHYTFDNNTISVEYYDFKSNTITKNIIVEKSTYKDLLYGQEKELTQIERYIIENTEEFLKNGIDINYTPEYDYEETETFSLIKSKFYQKIDNDKNWDINFYKLIPECDNILSYIVYKQILKNGKEEILNVEKGTFGTKYHEKLNILVEEIISKSIKEYSIRTYLGYMLKEKQESLRGKKICVDFVETENVDLYINKVVSGKGAEAQKEYIKEKERKILKTDMTPWEEVFTGNLGARVIFIGEGIDGESLNATEDEKIEYMNSINADMYIRIMIYDAYDENKYILGGYYKDSDKEIAYKIFENENPISKEEFEYTEIVKQKFGTYEEYCKDYRQSDYDENEIYIDEHKYNKVMEIKQKGQSYEQYNKEFLNSILIKLDNENVKNKCEIPTIAKFMGRRLKKDGKYIVDIDSGTSSYNSSTSGIISVDEALATRTSSKIINSK